MQFRAGGYNSSNYSSGYIGASGSILLHDCSTAVGNDRYVAGSSLLIIPFVDYNGNREHDGDEPILNKTTIVMRGSAEKRITSKGILLANIPADHAFKLVIPRQSFEDISWQITPVDTSLMMSARQSRSFYVPVKVLSELAGQVYTTSNGVKGGVGGVNMRITNLENGDVSVVQSDEWGFYSIMVVCGKYIIEPDLEQLSQYGLRQVNKLSAITINKGPEGVQIDNLDVSCDLKFKW